MGDPSKESDDEMIVVKVSSTRPAISATTSSSEKSQRQPPSRPSKKTPHVSDSYDDDDIYSLAPSTPTPIKSKSLTHACYNRYSATNIRTGTPQEKRTTEEVADQSHKKPKTTSKPTELKVEPTSSEKITLRQSLGISKEEAMKLVTHYETMARQLKEDLDEE